MKIIGLKYMGSVACTAALFLTGVAAMAQEASKTSAMPFLSISPDAGSMSMGCVTYEAGAFSHFSDAAASATFDGRFRAGVSYGLFEPKVNNSNVISAGAIYRLDDRFGFSFGFLTNIGEKYAVTSSSGYNLGDFTPADYRVGAGVSYKITNALAAGVTLNYASSSYGPKMDGEKNTSHTAFADVQVRYDFKDIVAFNVTAYNLGMPVKSYDGSKSSLPANVKIGASAETSSGKSSIAAATDVGMFLSVPSFYWNIGAEYGFCDKVFVRIGAHRVFSDEAGLPSYESFGLGGKLCGFRLDLSWCFSSGAIRNTLVAGLSYGF